MAQLQKSKMEIWRSCKKIKMEIWSSCKRRKYGGKVSADEGRSNK